MKGMKSCFYFGFILCSTVANPAESEENSFKFVDKFLHEKGGMQFKEDLKEAFLIDKGLGSIFEHKILKQLDKFFENVDDVFALFLIENLISKKPSEEDLNKLLNSKVLTSGIDTKIEVKFRKNTRLSGKKESLCKLILSGLYFYSSDEEDVNVEFDNFTVLIKKLGECERARTCFPLMDSFVANFSYPLFLSDKTLDYVISIGKCFKLLKEKKYGENWGDLFTEGGKMLDSIKSELALNTKHIIQDLVEHGVFTLYTTWCRLNKK